MTADEPSSTRFDRKMIDDLRAWRALPRVAAGLREKGETSITLGELEALLRAADERDALKREACAEPDEKPANVTPIRTVHYFGQARVVPVDLATMIDAALEEDERVIAWSEVAAHPFFRECYGTKASLLEAMLAKLTASTFTADIPAEVRERAGSTALGIPYAEPPHEPDECGGCVEDIAGGFGLYCSACGKPRPRRRTNCRCSVTPILHGHPAPDEVSIEITAEVPVSRPLDERDLLPFCDCGSVDKNGDDLGEHGDACPYHLAVLGLSPMVSARELDELCRRTLAAQARLA